MDEENIYSRDGSSAFMAECWDDEDTGSHIKGLLNLKLAEGLPCRIGLAGAQGTGKSTLARRLAYDIKIPLVEQVSRTAKGLGFVINKKSDIKSQIAIWLGQLHEQLNYYHFITDRTLIDHFAYLTWLDRHLDLGMDSYIVNALGNVTCQLAQEQYTIIFYLPISWPLINNGIRSVDRKYQAEIDEIILSYLNAFGVEYFPLPGDSEIKFGRVMEYLQGSGLLESVKDLEDEDDDDEDD